MQDKRRYVTSQQQVAASTDRQQRTVEPTRLGERVTNILIVMSGREVARTLIDSERVECLE